MAINLKLNKYSDVDESTPYIAFGHLVVLDENFKIPTIPGHQFRASKFFLPDGGDLVLYMGKFEGNDVYVPFVGLPAQGWIYTSPSVKIVTSYDFGGALGPVASTTSPVFWYASGARVNG